MASFLNKMKHAASKLGDLVQEATTGGAPTASSDGDSLDVARSRLVGLRQAFVALHTTLLAFSRTAATFASASGGVATEWEGVYAGSPARANSLQAFLTNQRRIQTAGERIYRDVFGWDVLRTFDDWDGEAARMAAELDKFAQAKKNRLKRSEPLTPKEEANMETARVTLEQQTNAFLEKRYAALDKAFVRFMELQLEFFREGASASDKYQPIVDNYRKRFPRQSGGADTGEVLGLPPRQEPMRSSSTPPHQEEERPNGQQPQQQRRPTQTQAPPPQQQRPPPQQQQQQNGDDSSDSESDSGSDTDSSGDEDTDVETPLPTPKKSSNAAASSAAGGVIDLFDFPSTAAPAKQPAAKQPAPAAAAAKKSSQHAEVLDFFGAPTSAASSSSSSSTAAPSAKSKSTPKEDDGFDFTGGGGGGNVKVLKPISVSSSSPQLQQDRGGVHSFDPFGMASPTKSAAPASSSSSSSSDRRPARSSSPPMNAPGTSTSGLVNAYIPPTEKLQEHIEEQQAAKVAQLREADTQAENALEARRDAESSVEGKLNAWELNKDGNKKNIRNLLSSVHTVLWPNSGWKPLGIADLIDFAAIKKAHMKVIRVVHPDKLTDATPEQLAIALRVFDSLNTAFDQFKTENGM